MYLPISSRFGPFWIHHCAALKDGPEWARRERMIVDAGSRHSRITFAVMSIPLHAHLFREPDGLFHVSSKDRAIYPAELLTEIEQIVNSAS